LGRGGFAIIVITPTDGVAVKKRDQKCPESSLREGGKDSPHLYKAGKIPITGTTPFRVTDLRSWQSKERENRGKLRTVRGIGKP